MSYLFLEESLDHYFGKIFFNLKTTLSFGMSGEIQIGSLDSYYSSVQFFDFFSYEFVFKKGTLTDNNGSNLLSMVEHFIYV